MDWSAVIKNPFLKNLPFKIELNKWGQILMSPASNNYGNLQFKAGSRIHDAKKGRGEIIIECSINTSQGVKAQSFHQFHPLGWMEKPLQRKFPARDYMGFRIHVFD